MYKYYNVTNRKYCLYYYISVFRKAYPEQGVHKTRFLDFWLWSCLSRGLAKKS